MPKAVPAKSCWSTAWEFVSHFVCDCVVGHVYAAHLFVHLMQIELTCIERSLRLFDEFVYCIYIQHVYIYSIYFVQMLKWKC